jgi:protein involved in polysaccharide export with SLBB domain
MNRLSRICLGALQLALASTLVLVSCPFALWGQQPTPFIHSTAITQENSRAEEEALQVVSLSADKIIPILQDETGLMLEVKKALVRQAFEQGRVLNSDDLTDETIYRLVRDDENVRIIATRQIEERAYVRAKPTRDELARNLPCQQQPLPTTSGNQPTKPPQSPSAISTSSPSGQVPVPTQEENYWSMHESDFDCYLTQHLPSGLAPNAYGQQPLQSPYPQPYSSSQNQNGYPSQYPQQQNPFQQNQLPYPGQQFPQQQNPYQNSPSGSPIDMSRQLQFTQMQTPPQGYFGMSTDQNRMASMQPGNMNSLLTASQAGLSSGMSGMSSGGTGRFGSGMGGAGESGKIGGLNMSGISAMAGLTGMSSSSATGSPLSSMFDQGAESSMFPQPMQTADLFRQPLQPSVAYPKLPQQPMLYPHANPYADIPSLYDLYVQYPRQSSALDRFGQDIFLNGTGNFDELPMDMPVGPEYVIGPGDGLTINLTGGVSERLQRVVDREGRMDLPEVGVIGVSGKSLGDLQHMVQHVLREQFRDVTADVSLARLRTVRVYVVGDVQRPGPYDVSALSTPLNALYLAGGPTSDGSLRILRHYRGKELIQEVDLYDLLLHGARASIQRLEPGDTIQVPPLTDEVSVEGMVRRPAVYELHGETNLAEVLQLAGGVLPTGTLRHVDVERVVSHDTRTMLRLDIPENNNQQSVTEALESFKVQDGDKIKITPILPYADKTVYLDGHVFRPGKFGYREGMKVTDLIKSYKDLLPEPSMTHAEIIRLNPPGYTPVVLAFNLGDVLSGKDEGLVLKPFDTVRVFGRYDLEDPPVITVTGEVRDPGDHLTNGLPHLRDAVYLAGGPTADALLDDAQVFRRTPDGKMHVISVNLAAALNGDAKDDVLLQPKDRIFVHRNLAKADPAMVTIEGQVARPGKYPMGQNMTAADLVRFAGGFKRGAYTGEADLTRYDVEEGAKIVSDHVSVPIARAMADEPDADVRLHDGDVLTIRELSGWEDLGATIQVKGEVAHPGGYGIQAGERLSSILARAGGLLPNAYPYGAIFERVQVRELEEKNRADLIQRVQAEAAQVKLLPGMDVDQQVQARAAVLTYQKTVEELRNTPPVGRLVIHISSDVKRWANTPADIQVRAGDVIYIPKKPNIVLVDGAVYNPTAITSKPGKNVGWYLKQAGGPTNLADKRAIFVVRADGSVAGGPGGMFTGGVQSAELRPGDMIVVPEQTYSFNTKFKTILQTAQLAASTGIATYYFARF